MLIKFQVRNFKQFHDLTMDFTDVRDYCFQKDCLSKHKQPLIKTALIFGSNASGKSNLGFAHLRHRPSFGWRKDPFKTRQLLYKR